MQILLGMAWNINFSRVIAQGKAAGATLASTRPPLARTTAVPRSTTTPPGNALATRSRNSTVRVQLKLVFWFCTRGLGPDRIHLAQASRRVRLHGREQGGRQRWRVSVDKCEYLSCCPRDPKIKENRVIYGLQSSYGFILPSLNHV